MPFETRELPSRGEVASVLRERCGMPAESFAASRILLTSRAVRSVQDGIIPELEKVREKNGHRTSNYLAICRSLVAKTAGVLRRLVDEGEKCDVCLLSSELSRLKTTANGAFLDQARGASSLFALQIGDGEVTSELVSECT